VSPISLISGLGRRALCLTPTQLSGVTEIESIPASIRRRTTSVGSLGA
jgi:hypothetical protein